MSTPKPQGQVVLVKKPIKNKGGRPRETVPIEQLEYLTFRKAEIYCAKNGRPTGREKLQRAVSLGHLPCWIDECQLDSRSNPIKLIARTDLDDWLNRPLKRFQVSGQEAESA